jgi:hypothetical protein
MHLDIKEIQKNVTGKRWIRPPRIIQVKKGITHGGRFTKGSDLPLRCPARHIGEFKCLSVAAAVACQYKIFQYLALESVQWLEAVIQPPPEGLVLGAAFARRSARGVDHVKTAHRPAR